MNQAIQILDGCAYIEEKNAVKVDVMSSGQMLVCYIGGLDKESLIKLYNTKQFEIEELIESKLAEDQLNSDGDLWLTVEQVNAY
jgi:hypothetical protein